MIRIVASLFVVGMLFPVLALSAAFTDPVKVSASPAAEPGSVIFGISPPFWSTEASWPLCWNLRVRVPSKPPLGEESEKQHQAALKLLQETASKNGVVYFGPAGKGLKPSKEDRCLLDSRRLSVIQRIDGITAVVSFYE